MDDSYKVNNSSRRKRKIVPLNFLRKLGFLFSILCFVLNGSAQSDPSSFPGLTVWLRADSGIVLSGGSIIQWQDISGNGNHFDALLPAQQPILIGTSILNNEPFVQFDGTKKLITSNNLTFNNATIYIVSSQNAGEANYARLIDHSYSTGFWIGREVGAKIGGGFIEGNAPYGNFNAVQNNVPSIITMQRTGSVTSSYINTLPFTTPTRTTFATQTISNKISLGATIDNLAFGRKDIYEVIIFNNAHSLADKQIIENYLRNRYTTPISLGSDIINTDNFCSETLTPTTGYTNYLWSTGETTPTISVNQSGEYWVRGTDIFGFYSYDTIQVTYPELQTPDITGICVNESITWDTGLGGAYTYLWSTSETTSSIVINSPGIYSVQVTDGFACNTNSGNYTFTIDTYSQTAFLGNDTILCSENLIALQVGAPETVSYLWPDSSTGTEYAVDVTGNYFVETVNINECLARDTIFVTIMGQAPTADFSFQNECFGTAVDFVDQSIDAPSDGIASWNWDFGDGQNSTDQNPSNLYLTADTFSVELYVETVGGCGAYHTEDVIVHALPVASYTFTGHCSADAIQFTDQSIFGSSIITSWLWNFGQPSSGLENVSNLLNPTKIYNESGSFDVILEVTDANNCIDDTTITLIIDSSPTAGYVADDGCEDDGIIFLNTSFITPPSTIASYLWDFGDATFSIMLNPVKTFADFGLQTVELEVTANNGCKDIESQTIAIHPNPLAEMQIGPMCRGTYTSLDNISTIPEGSISSTLWIINSTDSLTDANAEYVFNTFGQQEIVLQTTSAEGCTTEISDFVDVVVELDAAFDAGSGVAAAGEPFLFINQSIGADDSFWEFGDGFSSTDNSPEHIYDDSEAGSTLDVILIVSNNEGCSDTTEQSILIEARELDLALTNLFLDEDNGFYTIGVQLKNEGSVTIYEADLSIFLPLGLISFETWSGTLLPNASEIYIFSSHPNAYVNTENETDDFVCVEGIGYDNIAGAEQDLSNNKVCRNTEGEAVVLLPLYPNPANDEITLGVLVTVDSEISLEIIDSRGRLIETVISSQTLTKGLHNYVVDTSRFEAGTYFIVLKGEERVVYKMEVVH